MSRYKFGLDNYKHVIAMAVVACRPSKSATHVMYLDLLVGIVKGGKTFYSVVIGHTIIFHSYHFVILQTRN